jgi:hypothetical protein
MAAFTFSAAVSGAFAVVAGAGASLAFGFLTVVVALRFGFSVLSD